MLFAQSSYQFDNQPALSPNHSAKIRLVIADDHPLFRAGLISVLENYPGFEVVAQLSNGRQLVQTAKQLMPDIVITDLSMPELNGVDAIAEIRKFSATIRCIAMSHYSSEQLILTAVRAGALGFLLKTSGTEEIFNAILSAYRFNPYYCHTSAQKLNSLSAFIKSGDDVSNVELTDKEKAVLRLVCEDKSSKQIANELCLSSRTVEGHKQRIKSKFGTHTTVGIVLYAVCNGLYKPSSGWFF